MLRCARCEETFAGDDARELRAEHATEAGHPLCIICTRSLVDTETQTCDKCVARTLTTLGDIVDVYAVLPVRLDTLTAISYEQTTRGSGRHALPGGEVLVLLGPGGTGSTARRLSPTEIAWGYTGREHGIDNADTDGVSVTQLLVSWEDDWRHVRGEPATQPATVVGAAGYLRQRMRWAANQHPAFDEFATDLRQLLARLKDAAGLADRPAPAAATCSQCGAGTLVREYRMPRPCKHKRHAPEDCDADQGGLSDHWSCRRCGREYDAAQYLLAVRARREAEAEANREGWGVPWQVAATLGVPMKTVRTWMHRRQVAVACRLEDRRIVVDWADAHRLVERLRQRRHAAS